MASDDQRQQKKMLNKQYFLSGEQATTNQTSQEFTISANDELHWCPDMDYHLPCDNMFRRTTKGHDNSQISFTLTSSDSDSVSNQQFMNNNFDIHLAQIDIETFKSEDIKKIRFNQSMNASNDDTLRIVDSISSFTNHHLPNDECEALSIDSLDISIDNEINSQLIQKCSENDKTKYKIAMIDASVHSQLNNSQINSSNPFNMTDTQGSQNLQSPGSLVKMFIQNRINSNENSSNSNFIFDSKNNNNENTNDQFRLNDINSYTTEETIDESTGNSNSLNTVDSNELPLHVLDLSKKLRSLNFNKQLKNGSTSISSNTTSFTSTTTSSSATTDKRKPKSYNTTNPFLNICEENKFTKSASTQFPDLYQDKEVQASFDEPQLTEAPVLVYYPNYSLPDLSFLQEIFQQDRSGHPIYLSPVKHEPVKMKQEPENSVRLRMSNNNNGKKKCRPKSYTDYEALLNQDLSHIKDWDSLNLLLPDDFKQFIEQNNLLKFKTDEEKQEEQMNRNFNIPLPIKTMIPNNHRLFQNVKFRPQSTQNRERTRTKRFSLQEHHFDKNNINNCYNYPNANHSELINNQEVNSFMIRSQTMPNCQMVFNPNLGNFYPHLPPRQYHNCCHTCCHSGCHSPSINSSLQSSPQKVGNFNWELLSSSSLKKLLSFISKLDEYSSHSDTLNDDNINNNNKSNNHKPFTPHFNEPSRSMNLNKHRHKSSNKNSKDFQINHHTETKNKTTQYIKTKNSSDKTKIILKRPTSLNKNPISNAPVPKQKSSMIPVLKNNQLNQNSGQQQIGRNKNVNTRF